MALDWLLPHWTVVSHAPLPGAEGTPTRALSQRLGNCLAKRLGAMGMVRGAPNLGCIPKSLPMPTQCRAQAYALEGQITL